MKEKYMKLHRKAYMTHPDTEKQELNMYLDFISALYEYGVEFHDAHVGIDAYHGDYTVFNIALGE